MAAVRDVPDAPVYVYGSIPASLHSWGVEGALRLFHDGIKSVHRVGEAHVPQHELTVQLDWDAKARHLQVIPQR